MVEHNEHIAGQATSSFLPLTSTDATPTTREAFKIAETMPNEEGPEITHSSVHSGGGEDSAEEMDTGDLASRSGDYSSDEEDDPRVDQGPNEPTSFYTNFGGDQINASTSPQLATAFQNDWPSGSDVASAAPNLPEIDLISEFHDNDEDGESSSTSELADERTVITTNPVTSPPATSVGPNENHSAIPLDASVAVHPVESLPNDFYDPEASSLGDHAIEDPLFAGIRYTRDDGSLINASDLHNFTYDQLLPTMFLGAPDTNYRRDDPYDALDAERFYVSDDEFCVEGPDASKAAELRTPGQTGAEVSDEPLPNGHAARQPDTPPPPTTTFSTDHPPPFDPNYPQVNDSNETDGEANDHAGGGGPVMHTETFERNLSIDQFIRQWFLRSRTHDPRICGAKRPITIPISSEAAHVLDWERPSKISRPEPSKIYDIQGIPWSTRLKVKRSDARRQRDQMYSCYHNLKYVPRTYSNVLPQSEDYFRPKTMYTKYRASMAHFQLRNLMSVTASNTLQYAYQSKVYSVTPFHNEQNCLINLSNPTTSRNFLDSVKISTMKAKYGVTLVGGFSGEYAYRGQISDSITMDGRVTKDPNGITNHIDVIQNRTNHSPQAVISSNDDRIRILDCATNKFINTHRFARAINCTDTSPDGRLRVIVGDAPDAWVVDSDNGKPIQVLSSHRDYGFACAWSPDMLHVATSNQDKTVNIWDARMWRILQIIESDVAGYRSLRFSPVGGGPRTLLMCEPADRIVLVNAQSYQTRQVHDFFGEIGGADFSPDGSRIWVANMDAKFGGFMEFDRREWGQQFGIGHTKRKRIENAGDFYYPDLPNEWLPEDRLDGDPRCVLGSRERKLRFQKLFTDTQFEMLDPYLG